MMETTDIDDRVHQGNNTGIDETRDLGHSTKTPAARFERC